MVILEAVRANPASVTLEPALIVSVEIFTACVNVGMRVPVETMRA